MCKHGVEIKKREHGSLDRNLANSLRVGLAKKTEYILKHWYGILQKSKIKILISTPIEAQVAVDRSSQGCTAQTQQAM